MRLNRLLVSIALVGNVLVGPANGATLRGPDTSRHKATDTRLNAAVRPVPDVITMPRSTDAFSNYVINWYSLNGGGDINSASPNNRLGASIGQSVAGEAQSTNYQAQIGFWYGAACACNCHGDPVCDDVIADVLDVVATINVAFRGAPALRDTNSLCPRERTDVDCSAATDVIDVVKMIDVAFRGADRATTFCKPCW
jgi:hypothetical protein